MEEQIKKRYEAYTDNRKALMQRIAAMTPEVVVLRPGDGQWSIAEVAQHLALVEEKMFAMAEDNFSSDEKKKAPGLKQAVKIKLMFLFLKTRVRVKAPTKAVIPDKEVRVSDSQKIWEELDTKWPAMLESMSMDQAKRSIVKHPIAGWMNLLQLLEFLSVHLDHHLPQVERTLMDVSAKLETT